MRKVWSSGLLWCWGAWITLAGMCGCAPQSETQSADLDQATSSTARTNANSSTLITQTSVGDYRIGVATMSELLGSDTRESRKRLASQGLHFEFERGGTLTGITVTSQKYALENGIAVGSKADAVREKLGEPLAGKLALEPNKGELDALVYAGYVFVLGGSAGKEKSVTAIRVGI